MTTEFGPIRVAVTDYIATVTIDRPPVNAVDREALRGIRDAFRSLDDRRDVRAAIFTGAGSRAFMGGADLNTVGTRPQGDDVPLMYLTDPGRVARDAMWAVTDCAVPVIGAINGPAIGAGLAFAACCDILVAAEHTSFGTLEINVGLLGASAHVSLLVGRHKAREMFFLGEKIPVAELVRLGAVRAAVPADELPATAVELAHQLASREPDRTQTCQRGNEPSGGSPPKGRVQDRAGLHGTAPWIRRQRRSTACLSREEGSELAMALTQPGQRDPARIRRAVRPGHRPVYDVLTQLSPMSATSQSEVFTFGLEQAFSTSPLTLPAG